ncbi:hypothetical protein BASA81_001039 [Batrachochytrium salamandrivorans]|nr:hypothetical protein BASA81_001039 [Batrachochytrium salamandrivorans]
MPPSSLEPRAVGPVGTRPGFLFSMLHSPSDLEQEELESGLGSTLYAIPRNSLVSALPTQQQRRGALAKRDEGLGALYSPPRLELLAPLLAATSSSPKLELLGQCLRRMKLVVGECPERGLGALTPKLWKRQRIESLARATGAPLPGDREEDPTEFVEACLADGSLQGLLVAVLVVITSSCCKEPACMWELKPLTCKFLGLGGEASCSSEQLALKLVKRLREMCSVFAATVTGVVAAGGVKKAELAFAPPRAFAARPMVVLLLHALLVIGRESSPKLANALTRVVGLQLWFLEESQADAYLMGLGAVRTGEKKQEALHELMAAMEIGRDLSRLLSSSSGNLEAVVAWTSGLLMLFPQEQDRVELFDSLLARSLANPADQLAQVLVECVCFKLCALPAKFAPSVLSGNRSRQNMCEQLLDSIQRAPRCGGDGYGGGDAGESGHKSYPLPVSPVSSLGGQSAFSTQRHESGDEDDDRFSVSSLNNKARSVSSATSSLLNADTKSDVDATNAVSNPLDCFELVRPSHLSTNHRSRLYSVSFLLWMRETDNGKGKDNEGDSQNESPKLVFDEPRVAETIQILDQGRKAVQNADKRWGTALTQFASASLGKSTRGDTDGIATWKVKVNKCADGHMFFGVATKDALSSGFLGEDGHGWGFLGKANLWHGREKKQSQYGEPIRTGDTVSITFDSNKGVLSFANQRKDFGVAFRNLPSDVLPAISLYERGDSVTLLVDDNRALGLEATSEEETCSLFWNHTEPGSMFASLERKLALGNHLLTNSFRHPPPISFWQHCKRLLKFPLLGPLSALCLLPLEVLPPNVALDMLPNLLREIRENDDLVIGESGEVDLTGIWCFSDSTSKHQVEIQSHDRANGAVTGYLQSKREGPVRLTGSFGEGGRTLRLTEHWKAFTRMVVVQLVGCGQVGLGWCRVETKGQPAQLEKRMTCFRINHLDHTLKPDLAGVFASLVGKLVLCLTRPMAATTTALGKWANSTLFANFPIQPPTTAAMLPGLESPFLQQVCAHELQSLWATTTRLPNSEFASMFLRAECNALDYYMLRFAGQAALAAIGGEVMANLRRHTIVCLLQAGGSDFSAEAQQLHVLLQGQQQPPSPVKRLVKTTSPVCFEDHDEEEANFSDGDNQPLFVHHPVTLAPPPPSQSLIDVWKSANRVVSWVVRERQQHQASYESLVHPVLDRVQFLLRGLSSPVVSTAAATTNADLVVSFMLDHAVGEKELIALEETWARRTVSAVFKCAGLKTLALALDLLPAQKPALLAWLDCDVLAKEPVASFTVADNAPLVPAAAKLTRIDFEDACLVQRAVNANSGEETYSHCLVGFENCFPALSVCLADNFGQLFERLVGELDLLREGDELDRRALLKATSFPVRNRADCDLARLALPQWKQSQAFELMDALARQIVCIPHSLDLLQELVGYFYSMSSSSNCSSEVFSRALFLLFELSVTQLDLCAQVLGTWEWMDRLLEYEYGSAVACHRGMRIVSRYIVSLAPRPQEPVVRTLFAHVERQLHAKPSSQVLGSESTAILQAMFTNNNWHTLVDAELVRCLQPKNDDVGARFAAICVLGGYVEPFRFGTKVSYSRTGKAEIGLVSQVGEHVEVVFPVPAMLGTTRDEDEGLELTAPMMLSRAELFPLPSKLLAMSPHCIELALHVLDQVAAEEEEEDDHLAALRGGVARLLPSLLSSATNTSAYRSRLVRVCQLAVRATETMGTRHDEHLVSMYFQALLAAAQQTATGKEEEEEGEEGQPSDDSDEGGGGGAALDSLQDPSATSNSDYDPVLAELIGLDMGFPHDLCRIALESTMGDIEQAIHFCLENAHNSEQLVDEYRLSRAAAATTAAGNNATTAGGGAMSSFDAAMVERLVEMGFPRTWCVKGLEQVTAAARRRGSSSRDAAAMFNQALAWILSNGDALNEQDLAAATAATATAAAVTGATQEPSLVRLVVNSGGMHSTRITDDLEVSCTPTSSSLSRQLGDSPAAVGGGGTFPSVTTAGIMLRGGGRWYYEVTLLTESCMQIGWCDAMFTGDAFEGNGVGDCAHSWSYDGYRKLKWHNANQQTWGRQWKTGQVVGCLADLGKGELWFSVDGSWEEGMGLAFRGLRLGKSYVRGLQPAISFNRSERFQANFGPTFKHSMCPSSQEQQSVLAVCAAVTDEHIGQQFNAKFVGPAASMVVVEDCFEEIVGDGLCDRYFPTQTASPSALMQLLGKRQAATASTATTVDNAGARYLGSTPPLPNPSAPSLLRDLPFPEACGLKKRNISSLNQALEELSRATQVEISQTLSRTSWTLFTLQARQALAGQLGELGVVLLDGSEGEEAELVCALMRTLLVTGATNSEVGLAQTGKALAVTREFSLVPWGDANCNLLLVHSIWCLVMDDFTFAWNETKLLLHPSLHFALWATREVFGNGGNSAELVSRWTVALQSPGTRLKTIATQVLMELINSPADVLEFSKAFGQVKRVGEMATRLMARGGVCSLQAVHSRYAMALCELAATLQASTAATVNE